MVRPPLLAAWVLIGGAQSQMRFPPLFSDLAMHIGVVCEPFHRLLIQDTDAYHLFPQKEPVTRSGVSENSGLKLSDSNGGGAVIKSLELQ